MDIGKFSELIEGLYASALEPAAWSGALHEIAGALGAVGVDVYLLRRGELLLASIGGVPDSDMAIYLERFHGKTRRYRAVAELPEDGVITDADFIDAREMRADPFYEEFLRPLGVYHSISAVTLRRGDELGLLGIQLPVKDGPPTERQYRLVKALIPHVRRAQQMHFRLAEAELRRRRLAECIGQLQVGVLLIDRRGHVRLANAAAQELLRSNRGLLIHQRALRCRDAAQNRTLQRALQAALGMGAKPRNPGDVVVVDGPPEHAPLTLLVCPVSARIGDSEHARAMVVVSDPDAAVPQSVAVLLQSAYGLTPAEAKIATALADGHSLRTIARQRQISFETARTHLKRIFDKTGVRNQAGLVRLILRSFGHARLHFPLRFPG